ncbi:MAG TPA: TonB-dependent receptor plug domain-containing protein [Edaphocola sp.]|nr:TonB-dependent receptor plug domain-containing protein [Edaphocola sp.]
MKKPFLLSATICIVAGFNANAQTYSEADSTFHQNLDEVVVNALSLTSRSPFSFKSINKKEIQRLNDGRDLPFLLSNTPSVLINSDAGNGVGYTDIRVRGTDATRTNITVNGIPINDPESQGVFFVNFPDLASSTNNIQVQRGVGSSTNGSGAFGASINMNNTGQEINPTLTLINSVGSYGTIRNSLLAGTGQLKNGFNTSIRLSKIKSDGYIQRSASDLKSLQFLTSWNSKDGNTNLKFNLFTGKEKTGQAWDGVPEDKLSTDRRYNGLGLKEDGTYYKEETDNYQQDYYQLFFNQNIKRNLILNTAVFLTRGRGYYDEYKQKEKYSTYGLPPHIIGNDTILRTSLTRQIWLDNYYYGGVLNLKYFDHQRTINFGGAILQYDALHYGYVTWAAKGGIPDNYEWYHLPANKFDANAYLKIEESFFDNLYATLDLQFRRVSYSVNGFRKNPEVTMNVNYNFFNPKMGLSYFKNSSKYFVSFAIAQKEPNRNDFEAGILQLPKPEKLYDLELGYSILKSKFNLEANVYYMNYKDQLILSGKINDVGAYTRVNVPNSYRMGLELSGNYSILSNLSLFGNMTLSQNKIKTFTEYIDDYDLGGQKLLVHENTDIALSPSLLAQLGVQLKEIKLFRNQTVDLNLNNQWVARQYLDNTQNIDRSITPYSLLNFRLMYPLMLKSFRDIQITASINNILDKKYESKGYTFSYFDGGLKTENFYFPQAGRNYNLMLLINF